MTVGPPGEELSTLGTPLFACELEGGAEALATQLVDVPVVPGSDLLLRARACRAEATAFSVIWGEPAFIGAEGEASLLALEWQPLAGASGRVSAWRATGHAELLLGGRPCDAAISMLAGAGLRVRVPAGAQRFVAECGFDAGALPGPLERARCSVHSETRG